MEGFDWSEDKRRKVLAKHGIDLRDVPKLFSAPHIEDYDYAHSDIEDRWYILAELDGRVVRVVYTWVGRTRFIITAFRANADETLMFYDYLFGE
jgi:uncharacterized DUF497 family protein